MFYLPTVFRGVFAISAMLAASNLAAEESRPKFALAIHGGAGWNAAALPKAEIQAHEKALGRALEVGRKILAEGGTSLDAVEQTIRALEDDPLYNAGLGAVFNSEGKHELDASIMDGKTKKAGGVGGVTTVKNPISLARLVMTETRHVLLIGDGAEKFADEMRGRPQVERVPNSYFDTDERRKDWQEALEKERQKKKANMGTVGCVALDTHGNLAAGTSTGGITNKKWGRVGDSPIIGAGTFADNATCAVSCTGIGEHFIRNSAAFHVSALMAYKNMELDVAVKHVLDDVLEHDTGGIIAIDRHGQISMRMNTTGMARAAVDSTGKVEITMGE